MKFSPSIRAVLGKSELSIEQMIHEIHDIGYPAFEFWTWWHEEDLATINLIARTLDMRIGSICTRFISLVDRLQRDNYLQGLQESIDACKQLGCDYLVSQTGNVVHGVTKEEQQQSLIEGLQAAVPYLEKAQVTLMIEPLNTLIDHKGYYLTTSAEAFHIVEQVDSEWVKVVFDIYHQHITEGITISNIINNIDKIAYFHVADYPGRHEVGTGEINYHDIFEAINVAGFDGYVGLEYFPKGDGLETLKKFWEEFKQFNS